ncbi:MAG: hypothetical protein H6683_01030 [Deltaproteobacteria bacterium]|nr:hypothetical protein [Deltaproteobacteria bacterium]
MSDVECENCGAPLGDLADAEKPICPYCGSMIRVDSPVHIEIKDTFARQSPVFDRLLDAVKPIHNVARSSDRMIQYVRDEQPEDSRVAWTYNNIPPYLVFDIPPSVGMWKYWVHVFGGICALTFGLALIVVCTLIELSEPFGYGYWLIVGMLLLPMAGIVFRLFPKNAASRMQPASAESIQCGNDYIRVVRTFRGITTTHDISLDAYDKLLIRKDGTAALRYGVAQGTRDARLDAYECLCNASAKDREWIDRCLKRMKDRPWGSNVAPPAMYS